MTTADRLLHVRRHNAVRDAANWLTIALAVVICVPLVFAAIGVLAALWCIGLAVALVQRPGFWLGVVIVAILARLGGLW